MAESTPIRSYQRIFKPERRIYQVEGHRLPVPGGIPLRWMGYAVGALVASIALASQSVAVAIGLALMAALYAAAVGGRTMAALVAVAVLGGAVIVGLIVGMLDWPLRLIVLPALVATLATQATPDGRAAHRYALSWVELQVRPARHSLGRALKSDGERHELAARLWVARDWHVPSLRRAEVRGPARVKLAAPLSVTRGRLRTRRLFADRNAPGPRATVLDRVELHDGETLELRP